MTVAALVAALAAGCAAQPLTRSARPASVVPDRASLPLEAIGPTPSMPERPTTRPLGRPPVAALLAYAAARDALARNDPATAVTALRRAADLDPDRFDVQYDLGRALIATNAPEADAIPVLTRAADLDPDRVDVRTELGRLYLSAQRPDDAIAQGRAAMLTTGYRTDAGRAAVVDLLLAEALAADGYDRAALDRYTVLLARFKDPALPVRDNPDLLNLTEHPALLFEPIGRLYDRLGDWATAAQAYAAAVNAGDGDRFDLQVAMAMDRARLGRGGDRAAADAALRQAAGLVARDGASPQSLQLLADVCRELGRPDGQVVALRQLSAERPTDVSVLFASADALVAAGRADEAAAQLEPAWRRLGKDVRVARRLVGVDDRRGDLTAAAQVVISTSAADPDTAELLARGWDGLVRPWRPGRLTPAAVAGLAVPPDEEPARQFWLARTAATTDRTAVVVAALDRAIAGPKPYPPAVRARVALIGSTSGLSDAEKGDACERLAARLPPPLAAEVRGRSCLSAHRPADAVVALTEAKRLGNRSPAVELAQAEAAHEVATGPASGTDPAYERALSGLALRSPWDEDAYVALFGYFVDPAVGQLDRGLAVLTAWRASDPDSVPARLLQARSDHQLGNGDAADRAVDALLQSDGDDPDVLSAAAAVFGDRRDLLIAKLEGYRSAHPTDTDDAVELFGVYVRAGRKGDAIRTLDQARASVAGNADALYPLASLYDDLDQRPTAEDVLAEVLRLDPTHAGASNDLGFSWADAGRNLDRAEALIRTAVAAEPDNAAFLDSLGWVLYKRGRFAEARPLLERAAGPAPSPGDPAVLDHLGDTLYRLDRRDDAERTWQRALAALTDGGAGDDQPALRLQLQQKVKQAAARRKVDVAPLAAATKTAKSQLTTDN
jgi:tetratricopeptide (TPR) repeat protein